MESCAESGPWIPSGPYPGLWRTPPSPLGTIAGPDPKDPHTWSSPVPDYRAALDGNIKGMRVGVLEEFVDSDAVDADERQAMAKAVEVLGELGATTEVVSLPLAREAAPVTAVLLRSEPALDHREWLRNRLQDYGHDTRIGLLLGSIMPARLTMKSQKIRSLFRQRYIELLQKYDVVVLPTSGRAAQPVEDDPPITSKATSSRLRYLFTYMFNLASAPAVSVPCGLTSSGLPIGLQIGGRPDGDAAVLKVAHAYEQATPWHTMRPPGGLVCCVVRVTPGCDAGTLFRGGQWPSRVKTYTFRVKLEEDDDGRWGAWIDALRGCTAWGIPVRERSVRCRMRPRPTSKIWWSLVRISRRAYARG